MNVFPFETADINRLNKRLSENPAEVIAEDEAGLEQEVERTAEEILS